MKSHTEYLVFQTKRRREIVHITEEVEQVVRRSGVKDGLCFVSPMHITAAVYVNDLESGLIEDIGKWLEELAPAKPDYKHHQPGEDNGDAAGYRRQARPGHVAARLLCGVRRSAPQACDRESAGG